MALDGSQTQPYWGGCVLQCVLRAFLCDSHSAPLQEPPGWEKRFSSYLLTGQTAATWAWRETEEPVKLQGERSSGAQRSMAGQPPLPGEVLSVQEH